MARTVAAVAALVTVTAVAPAPASDAATAATRVAAGQAEGGLGELLRPRIPGIAEAAGRLYLDGAPHFFVGLSAYSATTDWSVNWGCGTMMPNLDTVFGALPPGSLVRTWAFQALAYDKFTHTIDFAPIDRVVAAAKAHHDFLVLALSDQAGTCDDGHFHDAAWYAGGYKRTYDDNGRGFATTMGYLRWVKTVVARYEGDHTVAVYEPVNEPEASTCNAGLTGSACFGHTSCHAGATAALRGFFDTVGRVIKSISSTALVSTGVIGGDQCGVAGTGYRTIAASKYVDITTVHDYTPATPVMTRNLRMRLEQAAGLAKPLLIDESGIDASATGAGCMTLSARATAFAAKLRAARRAGADGYVPWDFEPTPAPTCTYAIAPGDPVLGALTTAG